MLTSRWNEIIIPPGIRDNGPPSRPMISMANTIKWQRDILDSYRRFTPMARMLDIIESIYPNAGNERRPYPLDTINLSHDAMKYAIHEIASMRLYAKLPLLTVIPS